MLRPRMLPELSPPVPLTAPPARTVLLVKSFVSALPVEARLTQLEPLLAALGYFSIAAGSVRTLLAALAFLDRPGVIFTVTWIFGFFVASLMFCSPSPSSSSAPLLGDDDSEVQEEVSLSEDDELHLDFLLLLTFFDFFPDRQSQSFCRLALFAFPFPGEFSSLTAGPGCDPEDSGPILVDTRHQLGLKSFPWYL